MQIFLAEEMGMCFGVRDALKTMEQIQDPDQITIHGQLVHNPLVLQQLEYRGFRMTAEQDRHHVPKTDTVLITAHGLSNRERQRLQSAGKQLIDTTCPLVRRVHEAAMLWQGRGYHILLIGKAGHVEVQGIIEDLQSYHVVLNPEDVRTYHQRKLAILCQTTIAPRVVEQVRKAICERNPEAEICFVDTTCHPTRSRQLAVERLLPQVDGMIVIGGKNSNNTKELVDLCRSYNKPTWHIESADDLEESWFQGVNRVGITAGTSTLESSITEVQDRLQSWARQSAEVRHSKRWQKWFARNVHLQLTIPWQRGAELTPEQRTILLPSLQDFQLGESSDGKRSMVLASRYAEQIGDLDYAHVVRLFFAEEQRHAAYLARFLELCDTPLIQKSWTDFCFRRIRRLFNLELLLMILLIAEWIGKIYYQAILHASQSTVLRRICTQILRDEKQHVRFHIERLYWIRQQRPCWKTRGINLLHRWLFLVTRLAVWFKHGSAFRLGGYSFLRYWRATQREIDRSLKQIRR